MAKIAPKLDKVSPKMAKIIHNCPGNICPGDICPYQQNLSCYWLDLDQNLNKGSWEHKQQIITVTTISVHATFVLGTFVHISNISISKLNTFDFSLVMAKVNMATNMVFIGVYAKNRKNVDTL